jgi:hypothetical protein
VVNSPPVYLASVETPKIANIVANFQQNNLNGGEMTRDKT